MLLDNRAVLFQFIQSLILLNHYFTTLPFALNLQYLLPFPHTSYLKNIQVLGRDFLQTSITVSLPHSTLP